MILFVSSLVCLTLSSALPDHFQPILSPVHAPAHHAPVHHVPVHHAPAYHAPVYKETPHPYSYKYGVHDDYSGANFDAGETADGNGNVEGSYSVLLPDGRVQHVKYHADHHNGYVADVTYEGAAHHPHHAPAPYHH